MRRYVLGAMLLKLDDPTIEVGRLSEPLLTPNSDEREGYVPNVIYSCGSIGLVAESDDFTSVKGRNGRAAGCRKGDL